MPDKGIDYEKYSKIYNKKGVMTKKGGFVGKYGDNPSLDKKWDRYGHACEGKPNLEDLLSLDPESLIDIGCGYNEFLGLVKKKKKNVKVLGVDIACPGADLIAPAHILPIEDNSFDMLVSFDCMEHIPEDEVSLSFKEFARVSSRIYLKISLTHSETKIDGEPVHVCVKDRQWWLEKAREYFPNASIRRNDRPGTLWESITVYGDNRKSVI